MYFTIKSDVMKKILFAMVICLTAIFTAWSDDNNENKDIRIPDDQKKQTAYADDTEKEIHFTATTAWSTESIIRQKRRLLSSG